MAGFRFRLEASLRLAEQALDIARRKLAEEVLRWQECSRQAESRKSLWEKAIEGQREAGWHRPQDLGAWQVYSVKQLQLLRASEAELEQQEQRVNQARFVVVAANQELEKFKRLKEKQAKLFLLKEQKRAQAVLDEAGQVLYWQQQNIRTTGI